MWADSVVTGRKFVTKSIFSSLHVATWLLAPSPSPIQSFTFSDPNIKSNS